MNFDLPIQHFVAYIPLIERFLLAEDKQKFLTALPKDSTDALFMQLCTEKLNWESHQNLINKLGLSHFDKTRLQKLQTVSLLLDEKSSNEDRDKAIDLVKRELGLTFDHPKPTTANNYTEQGQNQAKLSGELKPEDYSLDKYLEVYNSEGSYAHITEYGLTKINKDKILNLRQNDFDAVIRNYNFAASNTAGLEILRKYVEVKKQTNKNFVLQNDIFSRLTARQLEELHNYVNEVVNSRDYVLQRYKKSFGNEISTQFPENDNKLYNRDQLNAKKELLKRGLNWLRDLKLESVASFIDQLTIELLNINILRDDPELDIFFEYLKRPRGVSIYFTDDYRNELNSRRQGYQFDSFWFAAHQLNYASWPNDNTLLENYLRVYFKHHSDPNNTKQFEKYFKADFLSKLVYKIRLEKGQNTPDLHAVLSIDEQTELKNRKQLTISDKNKKKFSIKENISLLLLVKNIQEVTAEIYQISTEKHYLNSSSQIDNSISLEFLQPLKKVTKAVDNSNPFKVNEVEFNLSEHLQAKNSIFIVDFQGEGILSRAVIRRGSIVAIEKPTLAGIELRFFQQDGTAIEELDIWLRSRKIHVNGKYTIPYGQSNQNLNIIAVKDGYAELVQVYVNEESYNWQVSYTYHEENFLVGSKAKVLLNAQLNSNAGTVSTQALKDTTITVNTLNHLGIPSTLSFSGIKWDSNNEYELDIPIQSYLNSIDIQVTAKVDKYVGKPEELTSNKTIAFRQEINPLSFVEFFLSSTSNGFVLRLLGKNGEAKPFISVNLQIHSKLYNHTIPVTLMTDNNGEIKLGRLENLKNLTVNNVGTVDIETSTSSWNLDFASNEVSFSDKLALNEGEEFYLPAYRGFRLEEAVLLRTTSSTGILSNESERLRFDDNKVHASLPKGLYILRFLSLNRDIEIEVAKLNQWGNSQQYIDNDTRTIYSLPANSKDLVSLPNDFNKNIEGDLVKISLKLQVKDKAHLQNVRVHVIGSAFVYRNDYSQNIANTISQSQNPVSLKLKSNVCAYLNDKELSDEHSYILNRQKQDKFIGNNLERPRVLLKRTFNRDTTVKKEELNAAKDFRSRDVESMAKSAKSGRMHMAQAKYDVCYASAPIGGFNQGITLLNNFLKHPFTIIPNLHGETIEFSLPKAYQSFVVIVASPSFAFERLYSLDSVPIRTNNLVSTGLKEASQNEAFTISRQCYKLQKGETLKVNRSSQWTAVSGSNLSILSEISNNKLLDWVTKWPSYTYEQKQAAYDQYVCHELNTYIKYKDPSFFNGVVKPFISNKLEKGVVDYCLLGDQQAEKYANLEYYHKLNAFEKCLLVDFLTKSKKTQKAASIAEALALEYKSLKVPYSQFENKFDVIMTSKQIAEVPVVIGMFGGAGYGAQAAATLDRFEDQCFAESSSASMCFAAPKMMMARMPAPPPSQENHSRALAAFGNSNPEAQLQQRQQFKPGFKEVEKTKEYVETTYYEMKNPSDSTNHIPISKFWVDLAHYFVNPQKQFLSESFIYLSTKQELSLAVGFLPLPLAAKYQIQADGEFVVITAESSFMVFVKEIKSLEFESKYGILISQRISDPTDQFSYEDDGTALEKPVGEFIKDKPYYLQTVITNTSTANLELQILIDIPSGSIPLGSNEYTQVVSQNIGSYQTQSLQRAFYFPQAGTYNLYPANASKNRKIISKANALDKIVVNNQRTNKKLETLNDVLVSGSKDDILNFLKTKNIFDSSVFTPYSILWLLKDKTLFNEVVEILKKRSYHSTEILNFGLLHKDPKIIRELILESLSQTPLNQKVLEYYPLTSQRAHKFMKSEKSTILNETFKQTYEKFLIESLLAKNADTPLFLTVFTYYLILQDRVKEASQIFKTLSKLKEQDNFPTLQYNYLACFIDMYTGYPNFAIAREISSQYVECPILTWQKLFKEVDSLLNTHDSAVFEEESKEEHDIRISIKGNKLSVLLPEKTTVEINFHAVNLELMFSNSPFDDVKLFSTIKPFKTVVVTSDKGGEQFVDRPEGADIYVNPVELSTSKQGQVLTSFLWSNDSVKVKLLEDEGVAVLFVDGKPRPGGYCKVYAKGSETRFYKDGYTDIQGRFKYVSQLDDVQQFSLLFVTEKGGITKFARTPSKNGLLG